ncbi:ABC transporter family substrate-binding protein [Devriesea agamarum]|uniref:ABC transporter family substrate-binding protein n=1 Tax=Devriesea agamarum TaxID=472569 RepID=UPI001E3E6663|nr:ABC transporter family substrate-binding protein [Devriesea agamarum]
MNPKKRDEIGEGGSLRLALGAFPANWNAFSADGNDGETNSIMDMVIPGMIVSDAKGEVTKDPQTTLRIEKVKDNPFTVEAELKPGFKWSDGTPIDYKSIENVFTVMNGSKPGYQVASSEGYDKVEKIEQGKNDHTAVITFKEPYADWKRLLGLMPDSLAASAEAFNTGWADGPKVTGGPFKIDKIDPGNKTVTLVPDENWAGDKPFLKQVLWTTVEDMSAAATAFKNGQLDVVGANIPAVYSVVKGMVGKNGITLRKAAGPNWAHFTLNGAEGRPLADVHVRRAVFNAINRKEAFLSVNSTMPYPKETSVLGNHMIMTNQDGYKDNSAEYGKYDLESAKKHLQEAGYTMQNGKAVKDGKPLEISYVYAAVAKENEAIIPVVRKNLQDAGITLKIQKVPPSDLFSKYVIPGDFDLAMFYWLGTPFFSGSDAIWRTNGEQNFGKVSDPEVDKLLNQAAQETDEKKRIDLENELDSKLWTLAGTLPLWQAYNFTVLDETLANYGPRGFQSLDWTMVGYTKGSPKLKS